MTAISPIFALLENLFLSTRSDVVNLTPDAIPTLPQGTVALAFNAESARGVQGLLSHDARNHSGDGNHLSITLENGTLVARLQWEGEVTDRNQGGIYDQELTFGGIDAGQDYHVAVTFDGSEAQLVVNGAVVDEGETGFIWTSGEQWTQVGAYGGSSRNGQDDFSKVFSGKISDVAIFDEVLPPADLASLADTGASAPEVPDAPDQPDAPDAPDTPDAPEPPQDGGQPTPPTMPDPIEIPDGALFAMAGPLTDVINLAPEENLALSSGTIALDFSVNSIGSRQGLISRDAKSFAGDGNHVSVYLDRKGDLVARFQDEAGGKNTLKLEYEGIAVGKNYHVAITFDGQMAQLLVNGEIVDQGESAMDWETTEQWLQFGAFGGGSRNGRDDYTDALDGSISNVVVFDGVMSEQDIADLANGSVSTPDTGVPTAPDTDPSASDSSDPVDAQDPPADEQPEPPAAAEPDPVPEPAPAPEPDPAPAPAP
ncbi:MAG: LamG-like jellyroll fold domain-containing protein, partial [Pseudomonadota bacterium]